MTEIILAGLVIVFAIIAVNIIIAWVENRRYRYLEEKGYRFISINNGDFIAFRFENGISVQGSISDMYKREKSKELKIYEY